MSNLDLPTKSISITDLIEERSKQILKSKLPLSEALFTFYSDKYPNLDGHIEFLDENGSTTTKLFFQLKGTEKDINYYDCEIEFLNYCYRSVEPTFLIFVNITQQKVFWEHIDQAYIVTALGIKDIANFGQQTKRITFLEGNLINQNTPSLIHVCKYHYQNSAKILVEKESSTISQQTVTQRQVDLMTEQQQIPPYGEVREKFVLSIRNIEEKSMLYHAFVYALKPFFLDQRSEQIRRTLLEYLEITDSEERFIIENLIKGNLLGRLGELIYVKEKEEAICTFNYFIDIGRIDLEKVTQLFSDYAGDKKHLLAIFLALDNKKADAHLARVAAQMKQAIGESLDNDRIFELLDLLGEFVYKVPGQAMEIVGSVLAHPLESKLIESPMGSFHGKSHPEVALKAMELLDRIRYIHPEGVLPLLAEIIQGNEKEQKSKAIEILKRYSKYDFNILTKSKMGYGPQRKVLDYVLTWPIEKRISNLDFVETVACELLGSSIEGTTTDSMDSITIHFGAVQPTEFLKTIRRETINLIFDLYQNIGDEQKKLRLLKVLEEAVRTPMNVAYGEDLTQMIADDAQYLITIYRRMLFDKEGRLVDSIPIAEEIEKRLYWFHRTGKLDTPQAKTLREDILRDSFYSLFRLLAGDDILLMEEEGEGGSPNPWDVAESKRNQAIDRKIEEVKDSNLNEWINILSRIAELVGLVGEWQFRHFRLFLRKLAVKKPDVAAVILDDALSNNKSVARFAASVLEGFRDVRCLDQWDAAVGKIMDKSDPLLVSAIAYSLVCDKEDLDLAGEIREKDLSLLNDIVECSGRFASFAEHKGNNRVLQHAIINVLTRNFRRDPRYMESLILKILSMHPEGNNVLVRELEFGIIRKWIDCSEFSKEGIDLLKSILVALEELDWDAQVLLLNIGKNDVRIIFDVFWSRIKKHSIRKKRRRVLYEPEHYSPVPYHFNDELKKYLSGHPQFQTHIEEWLEKVTPEWSQYNWNVSQFLKEMGSSFSTVLRTLIERKDETSLRKAVRLMDRLEGGDIELCMEVVRRTGSKNIINDIGGLLYSTGVVWGEDGIAQAFEGKAEMLRKYLGDDSEQVREFAKRMIKSFEDRAKKERQEVEERKQLRKIEFEG